MRDATVSPETRLASGRSMTSPAVILKAVLLAAMLLQSGYMGVAIADHYGKWRPLPDDAWIIPAGVDDGTCHAVILRNDYMIDDRDRNFQKCEVSRYFSVRCLDAEGIEEFGTVELPFHKDVRIKKIGARTIKPDGRIIEIGKKSFYDKTVFEVGREAAYLRVFAYEGLEAGDIVEYFCAWEVPFGAAPMIQLQHRYYTRRTTLLWHFWRLNRVDERAAARAGIPLPKPAWVITNTGSLQGVVEQQPSASRAERLWVSYADIPPVPAEPYMPPEMAVAARFIRYYSQPGLDSRAEFWEQAAGFLGGLSRQFLKDDEHLRDWMLLLRNCPRDLERDLQACMQQLQRSIECLSGIAAMERAEELKKISGVRDLLKKRFGDALMISRLAAGMLRELGYETTLFWTCDRSKTLFVDHWQSTSQFNMVGVAVRDADSLRWWYPSVHTAGTSELPWQIRGCTALLEDWSGEDHSNPFEIFSVIPMRGSAANSCSLHATLSLDSTGAAVGAIRSRMSWPNDPILAQELLAKTDKEVASALREIALPARLPLRSWAESCSVEGTTFLYACSLSLSGMTEHAGERLLLSVGTLHGDDLHLPPAERETEIWLPYQRADFVRLSICMPTGYQAASLAPYRSFKEAVGSYWSQCSLHGDSLCWSRKLSLDYNLFQKSASGVLRAFFARVNEADARPIVLETLEPGQ
ncbi:MAG: DUF3857 domain-containing protein [Candidatus Eisenbacteria sp.]|nr:DUF3857 domain-containing protein [Candidatus Eisenbacteria bacterium]